MFGDVGKPQPLTLITQVGTQTSFSPLYIPWLTNVPLPALPACYLLRGAGGGTVFQEFAGENIGG